MSNQQPRRSAHLEDLEAAACEMPSFDDGHELHPIIGRAARATPSQWIDAVVVDVRADGSIRLVRLDDGLTMERWHHRDLGAVIAAGSPVAVHAVYGVLAVGDTLVSLRAA